MAMQRTSADYPVRLVAEYSGKSSRGLAVLGILLPLKAILLIPHLIIVYVLQLAMFVVAYIGFFAALFTGSVPRGMHDFIAGVLQWYARTSAWLFGLTDQYPPFSLEADTASSSMLPPAPTGPASVPPPPPSV